MKKNQKGLNFRTILYNFLSRARTIILRLSDLESKFETTRVRSPRVTNVLNMLLVVEKLSGKVANERGEFVYKILRSTL